MGLGGLNDSANRMACCGYFDVEIKSRCTPSYELR